MNIEKIFILFEKIILIVIILSLLSCNINTQNDKESEKIKRVEFIINKTNKVILKND
tara:strand:+ start:321 stop:491 length:171 start_codon:yes stop_codon:yes gene_type:complete